MKRHKAFAIGSHLVVPLLLPIAAIFSRLHSRFPAVWCGVGSCVDIGRGPEPAASREAPAGPGPGGESARPDIRRGGLGWSIGLRLKDLWMESTEALVLLSGDSHLVAMLFLLVAFDCVSDVLDGVVRCFGRSEPKNSAPKTPW